MFVRPALSESDDALPRLLSDRAVGAGFRRTELGIESATGASGVASAFPRTGMAQARTAAVSRGFAGCDFGRFGGTRYQVYNY